MKPIIPHWFGKSFSRTAEVIYDHAGVDNIARHAWFGIALLFIAGYLLYTGPIAHAHEVAPAPRPLLPACYAADLRCTVADNSHNNLDPATAPLNLLPAVTTAITSPITSASITHTGNITHDGKWLQLMPGLIDSSHKATIQDEPLYNIPCTDGFADVYPCHNVDLLAHLPYSIIGGKANNDSWGWRDPIDGNEYALIGAKDGVIFLDISVPISPIYLGKLPTHGTTSSWRDMKVYQDHLFIVADYNPDHGMQVFDLRTLRTITRSSTPQVFQESAHYAGFEEAHNIAINEESGFAYVVGSDTCNGGLHMIDIRSPTAPVGVGCYLEDGYIHDTACLLYQGPDERYQGRELCLNSSVTEMTIVDVTTKANPIRVASYSNAEHRYIHQGWLTTDHRYFVMNDEMDELRNGQNTRTYLLNIETVDAPYLTGVYSAQLPSIDHNLYISDTYIYEANYTTGLRVLDGKDLALGTLTEVASFDTFPEHDSVAFEGAWTAYPYFRDGTVVVSTIESGVFILRPKLTPDVLIGTIDDTIQICRPGLPSKPFSSTITISARNGYSQTATLDVVTEFVHAAAPTGSTDPIAPAVTISPSTVDMQGQQQVTGTLTADVQSMSTGAYAMKITASADNAVVLDSRDVALHIADEKAAMGSVDVIPAPLSERAAFTLTWAAVSTATSYQIEVATDEDFTDKLHNEVTGESSLALDIYLGLNQRYFWRVTPLNGCGVGISTSGSGRTASGIFLPYVVNP